MNVNVEHILIALVLFTEAIIVYTYADYSFEARANRIKTLLTFSVGYTILFFVHIIWNNATLNTISYFVINAAILYMVFSCRIFTIFFHSVALTALMALSEIVSTVILSIYSGDYLAFTYRPSVLVALYITSKLIYAVLCVLGARTFTPHEVGSFDNRSMIKLCTMPISSMLISVIVAYISMWAELPLNFQIAISIGLTGLLFANIYTITIYSRTEKINKENLSLKLAMQKDEYDVEYYKMLEEQYERQRILVHDIKNHMQTINGFASEGNIEKIQRYIKEWSCAKALQKQARYCQNSILNIIIAEAMQSCSESGVVFNCDIRDKSIDFIDDTDISALFGNLLSNAYEAAKDSEEKLIELYIKIKPDQNTTSIKISNSCKAPPVKNERGLFVSHKEDKEKHGLGQKSIKRIIKKYGGTSETYYDDDEKRFEMLIVFSMQQ